MCLASIQPKRPISQLYMHVHVRRPWRETRSPSSSPTDNVWVWPDRLHVRHVLLARSHNNGTMTDRICKGSMQQRSLSFGSSVSSLLCRRLGITITPPAAARPRDSGGRSTRDNTSISFCKPTCICDLTSSIGHRRHRMEHGPPRSIRSGPGQGFTS